MEIYCANFRMCLEVAFIATTQTPLMGIVMNVKQQLGTLKQVEKITADAFVASPFILIKRAFLPRIKTARALSLLFLLALLPLLKSFFLQLSRHCASARCFYG